MTPTRISKAEHKARMAARRERNGSREAGLIVRRGKGGSVSVFVPRPSEPAKGFAYRLNPNYGSHEAERRRRKANPESQPQPKDQSS